MRALAFVSGTYPPCLDHHPNDDDQDNTMMLKNDDDHDIKTPRSSPYLWLFLTSMGLSSHIP